MATMITSPTGIQPGNYSSAGWFSLGYGSRDVGVDFVSDALRWLAADLPPAVVQELRCIISSYEQQHAEYLQLLDDPQRSGSVRISRPSISEETTRDIVVLADQASASIENRSPYELGSVIGNFARELSHDPNARLNGAELSRILAQLPLASWGDAPALAALLRTSETEFTCAQMTELVSVTAPELTNPARCVALLASIVRDELLQTTIAQGTPEVPSANVCPIRVIGTTVTVAGQNYPVEPHLAKWLQEIIEKTEDGENVTGDDLMEIAGEGKNTSREFKKLKRLVPPLAEMLHSDAGNGGGWYLIW